MNYWLWIEVATLLLIAVGPSEQCSNNHNDGLAKAQEDQRIQDLKLYCSKTCADDWEPWSPCNSSCGGGNRTRIRQNVVPDICGELAVKHTCPLSTNQAEACNENCFFEGIPSGGKCICPRGRSGDCCEKEIFCDFVRRPANSIRTGQFPARIYSVVEFSCKQGYQLQGEDTMQCTKHLQWSGAPPTCTLTTCNQPPSDDTHLIVLNPQQGYVFGDSIFYSCQEGFEIQGPESRECRDFNVTVGRWTGFTPRCRPVSCPDPGIPVNGDRNGTETRFRSAIQFSCEQGFKLLGSTRIECLASKTWMGHIPTCEKIVCEAPYIPDHGKVRVRKSESGTRAIFTCDAGYRLEGASVTQCVGTGYWSEDEPTCTAVDCGDPGQPENGYKDGIVYTFNWTVTYACHPGYILEGRSNITCRKDGTWSATAPSCQACPPSTYAAVGSPTCVACPENSHTATNASTSPDQCVCDEGFTDLPSGECVQVQCIGLTAPSFGNITFCDTLAGGRCNFTCTDGYIMETGSASRMCTSQGIWSGKSPQCSPCDINTYKSSEKNCMPCPENSRTDAAGQMREGCVCRSGFRGPPGGPCEDVNECEANAGRGPCEDSCENAVGSYNCRCTIPGYAVDEDDTHRCFPEHQCKNITEDQAPANGGLVCHWFNEQNSIFCNARCNSGFEHPDGVNDYETCGSTTGYKWSFRLTKNDPEANFPSCIRAFMPGIQLEAETAYFTTNCRDLTPEQQDEVKTQLADMLNEKGVCRISSTQLCEVKDMGIICGRTTRRRRRDTGQMEEISEVDLAMNISAVTPITTTAECNATICEQLGIRLEECADLCVPAYNRRTKAMMKYAERQLKAIYKDQEQLNSLIIRAANRSFEPAPHNNLQTSGVLELCEEGMAHVEGSCRECGVGFFLDRSNDSCSLCPPDTYQDMAGQMECNPCPIGTHTTTKGSTTCQVCQDGFWGQSCRLRCSCVHGICNPFTGSCTCNSGYEGPDCDVDIPGCRNHDCFPGVQCTDVPAPGTGFTCGACPVGYHGNGMACSQDAPSQRVPSFAPLSVDY